MGSYFVMSRHFNKNCASDFGLIKIDEESALNPKDNSVWKSSCLYDFGWGKENGYYRLPLPDFNTLFNLILYSENIEDVYGAAAIILEKYHNELLFNCEKVLSENHSKKEIKRIVEIFNLKVPVNRCSITNESYEQITNDYLRWKHISELAKKV